MSAKNFKDVDNKVDFIQIEHEMLDFWENEEIFNQLEQRIKEKSMVIFDGTNNCK